MKYFPKASFDVLLSIHRAESFKSYFMTPGSLYLVVKDIRPLLRFMNFSYGDLCSNF